MIYHSPIQLGRFDAIFVKREVAKTDAMPFQSGIYSRVT